jgi:enoyl-CoA hydratase/carnithine racemase
MNDKFIKIFNAYESLRKPVISSVHSYCLAGGTELTLCCDMVVASEDAVFGLPEIKIGVIPGGGALIRILRWMGSAKAKEFAMTGDRISAQEALNIGLVNKVVKREKLEEATMTLANKLVKGPPVALGALKVAMNMGGELDKEKGIAYALNEFLLLFTTRDQKEGMRAFLEKREANFIGE